MARPTRRELEKEVDTLRSRLEEAHTIIGEALGYGDDVADDVEPEEDGEEQDDN